MSDLKHGSNSTYNNHGCRCDDCKKAHADVNYKWRHGTTQRLNLRRGPKTPPFSVQDVIDRHASGESIVSIAADIGVDVATIRRRVQEEGQETAWVKARESNQEIHAAPHGANRYARHACRCDVCRAGNAEKMRRYRASLRGGDPVK